MPLMQSITEQKQIGKSRPEGMPLLSKNTAVFRNVLEEQTAAVSGTAVKSDAVPLRKTEGIVEAEKTTVLRGTEKTGDEGGTGRFWKSSTDRLSDSFRRAAAETGVPEALLRAVAKQESGFNEKAVSRSGAMGVMQLMPDTAKALGVSNPFDAEQNIMAGARLLRQKLKEFQGDLELGLAAYNAGSGAVRKYQGIPPYRETRNYVSKILSDLKQKDNEEIRGIGDKLSGIEGLGIGGNGDSTVSSILSALSEGGEKSLSGIEGIGIGGNGDSTVSSILSALSQRMEDASGGGEKTANAMDFAHLVQLLRMKLMVESSSEIGDMETGET